MLDSKSLFFEYYPITIILTLVFYFVGQTSLRLLRINISNDYFNFFLSLIVGCSILISVYAIVITGFTTVLTGGLLLLLLVLFFLSRKWRFENKNKSLFNFQFYKRWDVLVVLAITVLLKLINVDGELWLKEHVYSDYVFYSKISEFFNKTGIENLNIDYIYLSELAVAPYHYFDIWFNSLVVRIFDKTPVFCLIFVVYSIGTMITYCGFTALASKYLKKKYWILSLSVLFIVFNIGYFHFFDDIPFLVSTRVFFVNVINYSKLFPIYWFIILSFYFAIEQRYLLSITVALILIFYYSSVAPVIVLLCGLTGIYGLWQKLDWAKNTLFITFLAVISYFSFYFFAGESSGFSTGILDGFHELQYIKTAVNITGATFLQFMALILPLIPVSIILMNKKTLRQVGILLVIPFFIALVVWAILHKMYNSVQLFSNFAVPYLHIIIGIVLFYLVMTKMKALKMYFLFVIVLFCFNFLIFYIGEKYNEEEEKTALLKQHEHYSLQVAQALDTLNNLGGYFRSLENFNWAAKSPVFGALDQKYQSLLKNKRNVHSVSLSVLDTPIDSTDIYFEFEKSLVKESTFYRYFLKEGGQIEQLHQITSKFVKDFNIEYIFTIGNISLPPDIEDKIVAKLEDPLTGEKFYVLSPKK